MPNLRSDSLSQYPIFKIPSLTQWTVFVRSPYGEELLKAPDNTISFIEASAQASFLYSHICESFPDN